jgi:hypothetical protein
VLLAGCGAGAIAAVVLLSGCGAAAGASGSAHRSVGTTGGGGARGSARRSVGTTGGGDRATHGAGNPGRLPASDRPVPFGRGPHYRIPALSPAVAQRRPVSGVRCDASHPLAFGIHIELFANRLVVPMPAGIGVAPPVRRRGAYVLGGGCSYPLRTLEPTGVVRIDNGLPPQRLGALFAIWGQPLSATRLAGFTGPVLTFVDGRRWHGSPRTIPLRRHAQIVLEIGGALPPHPRYAFPPGL